MEPPVRDPYAGVVWEGGGREAPPYPDWAGEYKGSGPWQTEHGIMQFRC